jgi:hypothetical protein
MVQLRQPVHKRLGTQFKIFVRLKELANSDEAVKFLSGIKVVSDVHVSQYHRPTKITFIVERFAKLQTVEGLSDNFYYLV